MACPIPFVPPVTTAVAFEGSDQPVSVTASEVWQRIRNETNILVIMILFVFFFTVVIVGVLSAVRRKQQNPGI